MACRGDRRLVRSENLIVVHACGVLKTDSPVDLGVREASVKTGCRGLRTKKLVA